MLVQWLRALTLFFVLVFAARSVAAGRAASDSAGVLEARIAMLRAAGRYDEALAPARRLCEIHRNAGVRADLLADADRLLATLEHAVTLDSSARAELAAADRLERERSRFEHVADYARASKVIERQLEIRRRHLGAQNADVATTLQHLAMDSEHIHNIAYPESLYREALALRRAVLGTDHPGVAETATSLADLRLIDGAFVEADSLCHEALAIREHVFGAAHPEVARSLRQLAEIEAERTTLITAEQTARRSLEMLQHFPNAKPSEVADSHLTVGMIQATRGDYASAERSLQSAQRIHEHLSGVRSVTAVWVHYWRALLLYYQGNYDESRAVLRDAITVFRRAPGERQKLSESLTLLGVVESGRRQFAAAVPYFRESLELDQELYGARHFKTLIKQLNYGKALARLRMFALSDSIYAEVLRIGSSMASEGIDFGGLEMPVLSFRAYNYDHQGNFAAAESLLLVARKKYFHGFDGSDNQASVVGDIGLAELRVGRGDFVGADAYLTTAAQAFERSRVNAGSGLSAATFTSSPYPKRALVRLEQGRPVEAWMDLERAQGRLLADSLVEGALPLPLERVQAALHERVAIVGWLDLELRRDMLRSWGYVIRKTGPVEWVRLDIADRSYEELAGRLRKFNDPFAASPKNSALGVSGTAFSRRAAQALWIERMAPLLPHLKAVDELIVVSSNVMAGIPLGILIDGEGRFLAERFALSYTPSASIHARLCEKTKTTPRSDEFTALVIGDPPFSERQAQAMKTTVVTAVHTRKAPSIDGAVLRGVVEGDRGAIGLLPRLLWSRVEAAAVSKSIPNSTLLLGPEANEKELSRLLATGARSPYRVIHIATHALIDNTKPERSALILSQIAPAGVQATLAPDGIVTAADIAATWKLDAELVTLSGCETALGKNVEGEGVVGFSYPFLKAGAQRLLLSLWKVDDEATALLMQRFYENWTRASPGPMEMSQALREAMLWLRDYKNPHGEQPYAHPRYWAGFVLVG